jgi:hypothetical protein
MRYTVRSLSGEEMLETLATHVLARAYRAAWRAQHGSEPAGLHVMGGLDLIIDFSGGIGIEDELYSKELH